jgi:hypothetical protein
MSYSIELWLDSKSIDLMFSLIASAETSLFDRRSFDGIGVDLVSQPFAEDLVFPTETNDHFVNGTLLVLFDFFVFGLIHDQESWNIGLAVVAIEENLVSLLYREGVLGKGPARYRSCF